MKGINIQTITKACQGQYFGPDIIINKEITAISTDSRQIESNSLFIPIRGSRVDGHDFISQVIKKGALVSLSEKKPEGNIPYILVESTLQALKDIATLYLQQVQIPVVGITGSVGKTSTKEMIASVLEQKYNVLKTDGNFNNEIGLPLTVFRIRPEHQVAILEMGISDFGEMTRLTHIARPDIAVITNIGCCHLENLKTRDGILQAKTEIFQGLKEDGKIVLNGEDDKLSTIAQYRGIKPLFFGGDSVSKQGVDCPVYAKNVQNQGLKGSLCTIVTPKGEIRVHIPVPGIHMVSNALAGCSVGLLMGLTLEQIQKGIESLQPVKGRTNLIYGDKYIVIDDCYNANPVSMKSSIDILKDALGRKVCILGDMFELGKDEVSLHTAVGEYAAESDVGLLITIGDLSENIAKGASRNPAVKCVHFATKSEAIQQLPKLLQKGDSILVKASHGMEFPVIVEKLKEMDGAFS